jgi:hypothetical protein
MKLKKQKADSFAPAIATAIAPSSIGLSTVSRTKSTCVILKASPKLDLQPNVEFVKTGNPGRKTARPADSRQLDPNAGIHGLMKSKKGSVVSPIK